MYSRQLETFVTTADAGSFSKAAKRLYISPVSVIQQVNSLEARLGLRLFDRTNQGVTLTPAGESLYQDAADIMARADAAVERARRMQDGPDETIRVGTSLLMKCRLLPTYWGHMIARHPDTKIEIISLGDPYVGGRDVLAGLGETFDLQEGLYLSGLYRGKCSFVELLQTRLVCALPSKHPLAGKETLDFDDLRGETVVMLKRGSSFEFDALRDRLQKVPCIDIVDVPNYTMETFATCEMKGYVLMSPEIWSDIHLPLVTRPLAEEFDCPYGIIHSDADRPQLQRFVRLIEEMRSVS